MDPIENMDVAPKKKGRPKKIVQESTTIHTIGDKDVKRESPKKRGRKKKEPVIDENVVKQKKKRGRKAAIKYFSSSIRKKIPLTAVIQDNNQYILHLDVPDSAQDSSANSKAEAVLVSETDNNHVAGCDETFPLSVAEANDAETEADADTESTEDDIHTDLKELYQKRLKNRDVQDQLLIQKLEKLAITNEPNEIDPLLQSLLKPKHTHCTETKTHGKEEVDNNRKKGYFEMMYDFVHNEEWLSRTNVCCWWCCHQFEGVPLGLPLKYVKQFNKFRVRGVFCSFPCMLSFNLCSSDPSSRTSRDLINFLHFKLTGQQLKCSRAPPKWTLKMFGGELGIDAFRQSGNSDNDNAKMYKMIYYPMFMSKDYVEEVDIANIKSANQNVFVSNSHINAYKGTPQTHDKLIRDARTRLSKMEDTVVTPTNTIDKFIKFS